MSGMNADRMAYTPADKAIDGKAIGTVIVNLQKTPMDEVSTLRIWAKLDDAFRLLVENLGTCLLHLRVSLTVFDVVHINSRNF